MCPTSLVRLRPENLAQAGARYGELADPGTAEEREQMETDQ